MQCLEVFQTFNASFAALAELLDRAGIIDQDALAAEIERFQPDADGLILRSYHAAVIKTLRERWFSERLGAFAVIDGGKSDSGG